MASVARLRQHDGLRHAQGEPRAAGLAVGVGRLAVVGVAVVVEGDGAGGIGHVRRAGELHVARAVVSVHVPLADRRVRGGGSQRGPLAGPHGDLLRAVRQSEHRRAAGNGRPLRPIGLVPRVRARDGRDAAAAQGLIVIPAAEGVAVAGHVRGQLRALAVDVAGHVSRVDRAAVCVQRHLVFGLLKVRFDLHGAAGHGEGVVRTDGHAAGEHLPAVKDVPGVRRGGEGDGVALRRRSGLSRGRAVSVGCDRHVVLLHLKGEGGGGVYAARFHDGSTPTSSIKNLLIVLQFAALRQLKTAA